MVSKGLGLALVMMMMMLQHELAVYVSVQSDANEHCLSGTDSAARLEARIPRIVPVSGRPSTSGLLLPLHIRQWTFRLHLRALLTPLKVQLVVWGAFRAS